MPDRMSTTWRRQQAQAAVMAALPALRERAHAVLGPVEGEGLVARCLQHHLDLYEPLDVLYGDSGRGTGALVDEVLTLVLDAVANRPLELRMLDRRREVDPGWFQRSRMVGYVAYADRFAGDLAGVRDRLDYLAELGVTYLHLMPLLQPRDGPNDGGYAVQDYRAVDPRLGSIGDLEALTADLHARGMALCVDLVLNHTAAEHEWARRARAGEPEYRDRYLVFPDRTLPDRYERTLPEVFPDFAPGNFTEVEGLGWVWTTFATYQWDLNWANPRVFLAMLDTILFLADRGIDVLRMDAVPFMWKRMGTDCQNQPEVHLVMQALRAVVKMATPGVVFKAEAIVPPEQLVQYLGAHGRYVPECDLAYHNQLMAMLWSSVATRNARLAVTSLGALRTPPPSTGWVTYVRNHDDIGWAVSDAAAATLGWDGPAHRRFLADYFAGRHPGSFARGTDFMANPATGDARTSGMTATLVGLGAALGSGDPAAVSSAVARMVLLYSVVFSYGGIPLIYMGDEIALLDDETWDSDPAHSDDNRWLHRPAMDWDAAASRHDATSVEARLFASLVALGEARRSQLALRAGGATTPMPSGNDRVFAYRRQHPRSGLFVALANFSDDPELADRAVLSGLLRPALVHAGPQPPVEQPDGIVLPPWGFAWYAEAD